MSTKWISFLAALIFTNSSFAELKSLRTDKNFAGQVEVFEAVAASKLKCNVFIHSGTKAGADSPLLFFQDGMGKVDSSAKALYSGNPITVKLGMDLGTKLLAVDKPGVWLKGNDSLIDNAVFDQHTQADVIDCGAQLIEHVVKNTKGKIHFLGFSEGSVIVAQVIVKSKIPAERIGKVILTSTPILDWKPVIESGAKLQGKLDVVTKMVESGQTPDAFRKEMGMGAKYLQELYKADSGEKAILKLLAEYKKTPVTLYHSSFDPVASTKAMKAFQEKLKKDLPGEQLNLVEFKYFTSFGHTTSDKVDEEIISALK